MFFWYNMSYMYDVLSLLFNRYPNLNTKLLRMDQVRHLYDCGDQSYEDEILDHPTKRPRSGTNIDSSNQGRYKCSRVKEWEFDKILDIHQATLLLCKAIYLPMFLFRGVYRQLNSVVFNCIL